MVNAPNVFILGSPRSGTSITYFAMREVFRLPGRGESHVIPLFTRLMALFRTFKDGFKGNEGVLAADLDEDVFRQTMCTLAQYYYVREYGVDGFVDKTPGAEAIAGCDFILKAFPEAKFLLMQRNGIEVINSYQRKFSKSFEDSCKSWSTVIDVSARVRPDVPGMLVIDQFDLTNRPAEVAARVADYLNRPNLAADLAAYFKTKRVEQQSSHDWSRRLTLADVTWTEDEKEIFREICGAQMHSLGYAL